MLLVATRTRVSGNTTLVPDTSNAPRQQAVHEGLRAADIDGVIRPLP